MLIDRTTETISHFIGLFALKVEQERLRDGYEEFTVARRQAELVPVEPLTTEVDTSHKLRQTDAPPKAPDPSETRETMALDVPRPSLPVLPEEGVAFPAPVLEGALATVDGPDILILTPAPPLIPAGVPGSMLTLTVQVARLHDNDVIGQGDFRDAAAHAADLDVAGSLAASLHAPSGPGRVEIPTVDTALALHAAMQSFAPLAPEGAEVFTWLGASAPQKIVNGVATEEVPEWSDLLPDAHRETEKDAWLEDWELPKGYTPNPEAPEGHSIMAGGNLLVNEARISLSFVDAPLIAVGGTWINLDIVSQVALVSNRDEGVSVGDQGATAVYQIVEIEHVAKTASWSVPGNQGADAPPARISLEIVEGDLLVSNHIDQIIQLLDNDAFGMAITAANSAYILGANIVVNATSLVTAGFGYDLILIGGNFISIDTIHQSLVLLDDDRVEAGPIPEGPVAAAFDTETASAIEGRAEVSAGISGGIALPASAEDETEEEPTQDPAPDNLVVNKVLLKTVGLDTAAEMTASMAGILASPTDDLEALREKLLNDPALAGLEQARVLKINGDLILSNTIKQTILASDRDDIRVDGAAPPGLDIVAGQNAMLNAAAISLWGVDSKVMIATEGYSDLLIHQARLVDEPDAPETADPGLVSEAVAFLMDGIDATVAGKTADVAAKAELAAADAYDLMQSTYS
jgi:hypothetical protein